MYYSYIKALHVIFIVTWFSGLFYMVRLFIYNTEAGEKTEAEKNILHQQFNLMQRRLWYGITWPSAVLTLLLGGWLFYLLNALPGWLMLKLCFVLGLYLYHLSVHFIFLQQQRGEFKYSSQQLRIWNEVATIFLVAIVILAVVKSEFSFLWGLGGLVLFMVILMSAVRVYKKLRK